MAILPAALPLWAQTKAPAETLGVQDGLSQGFVNFTFQDREGFIWIGTRNGLNRYDGRQFEIFEHNPLDSFSIAGNIVTAVEEWGDFLVFANSMVGIEVYHKQTQRFYHITGAGTDGKLLSKAQARKLFCIRNQYLYAEVLGADNAPYLLRFSLPKTLNAAALKNACLGVQDFTLTKLEDNFKAFTYNRKREEIWGVADSFFQKYNLDFENIPMPALKMDEMKSLSVDSSGGIWVIGLNRIGRYNGTSIDWYSTDFSPRQLFLSDKADSFLILTDKQLLRFSHLELQKPRLSQSRAEVMLNPETGFFNAGSPFIDRSGIYWLGTKGYGIIKYNPKMTRFKTDIRGSSVQAAILIDAQGNYGRQTFKGDRFFPSPNHVCNSFPISSKAFIQLINDQHGNHWALAGQATRMLLFQQSKSRNTWDRVLTLPNSSTLYTSITTDIQGDIWIASPHCLTKYDPETQQSTNFLYNDILPKSLRVTALTTTIDGIWWIGTELGLVKAEPSNDGFHFTAFTETPGVYNSIQCNYISTLLPDPNDPGILWIGSLGGGMSRLDTRTFHFRHYNTRNGLPNNVIYGILADQNGRLWMSSNKGLIRLDPVDGAIKNYTMEDGLPSNEFNVRAFAKGPDGRMYFGCVEGLVSFNPGEFVDNPVTPEIRIVGLELNNQKIRFGDSTEVLSESIEYAKQLRLPYNRNSVTFEFAALEYSIPSKNRYRYFLKGKEQEWAHESTEPRASYLDLPPGKYALYVKACNSDGVWNDTPRILNLIILPPWYRTNLAYVIYAFLLALASYGSFRFFLQRLRLRDKLSMELKESERLKELDALKTKLYVNITHEFRTPLTVIHGMAGEVAEYAAPKPVSKLRQAGKLIQKNGADLLALINQLLDLAKLEAKALELYPEEIDFVQLVKYLTGSFDSLAATKDIDVTFQSDAASQLMLLDLERVKTILTNLFSNAIKFTPDNGHISVQVNKASNWRELLTDSHFVAVSPAKKEGAWISFSIRNTGRGIPAGQLRHIFNRFFQTSDSEQSQVTGTGIGLALVRELAELMKGGIAVRSVPDVETEFVALFEIVIPDQPSAVQKLDFKLPHMEWIEKNGTAISTAPADIELPSLLIIEDNADVMHYIKTCVEGIYRISSAENGQAGIDLALENVPDIILSDVMMPIKDGFEVVNALKNDERTSHIPIVLLTAKADLDSRIEGLERGADAYLAKPFAKQELLVWLRKLLESRRKLQKRYSNQEWNKPDKKVGINERMEDAFMLKVQQALHENISDEAFGVPELCIALGMSRTQLHNKIKAITGKSTSIFIRFLRLQKARELLLTTEMNVSEVAFEVGFRYHHHFSQYYFEVFGELPSKTRR